MALTTVKGAVLNRGVNVKDFGAKGDGVTDDTAAIQAAITSLTNGGQLHFPAGTYKVSGVAGTYALTASNDNIRFTGEGIGSTKIQLADGEDCHILDVSGTTSTTVEHLWLDGAYTTQTLSVHGIRATSSTNLTVQDVKITNCRQYAIGLQGGAHVNTVLSNIHIENTGADGIDFKNGSATDNSNIRIDNVTVVSPGLVSQGAGIDIRGRMVVNNYTCVVSVDGVSGIRFRGNTSDGGQESSLSNFHIVSTSAANTTNVGVNLTADDCQVSNGYVYDFAFGVLVSNAIKRNIVSNVRAEGCGVGFQASSADSGIMYLGCWAIDCTTSAWRLDADNGHLIGCGIKQSSGTCINITGNSDGSCIVGGDFSDTSGVTSVITNNGTNTSVVNCKGTTPSIDNRYTTLQANGLFANGSTGSGAVELGVDGTGTNVDLLLSPKGTGTLRVGTHTSTTDTAISGYITIKDSGGTTRKLAVIT